MKIAHISDIHLGYTSGKKVSSENKINLRELDGYKALEECVDQIINEGDVEAVICTGDFFHSPYPTIRTIVTAQRILSKLYDNNIAFHCLAGNHDSTDAVKDIPSNMTLNEPKLMRYCYDTPYEQVEIDGVVFHFISHHAYTKQKETMENISPVDGKVNILCTHGSCYDETLNEILHSDSEPREVIIPQSVLEMNWSYILLGHIHERGWVGSEDKLTDTTGKHIFYGGSLFRRGFSDKECKLGRGWTKWDITDEGITPTFFNITQREQFDIVIDCRNKSIADIEATIKEELGKIDTTKEPIVRVTLNEISKTNRTQLNWKQFNDITKNFLSFVIKTIDVGEQKIDLSQNAFSYDLLSSYKEYWEKAKEVYEKENRKEINQRSTDLLKEGQEKILEAKAKKMGGNE